MPETHIKQSEHSWLDRNRSPTSNVTPNPINPGRRSTPDPYNLNQAGRISSMIAQLPGPFKCPACGGSMTGIQGGSGDRAVVLLSCDGCGRSLVVPKPERR
jgi:hypothetical protein